MSISRDQVRDVAHLSRLEMNDDELDRFTVQLQAILDYASKLDALDISGVEPTSHAVPVANVLREDKARPSLPVEAGLDQAPEPQGPFFTVPRIIDEGEGH